MIMLDATVVSVALSAIRDSLHMLIPQGEPPLEWAERRYNIRTWTVTPKGGHFAPAEEPELVAGTSRRSSPPCTDHEPRMPRRPGEQAHLTHREVRP